MPFIDTEPAAIDRRKAPETWIPYRVSDPRMRRAMLLSLCKGDVPVTVGQAGGPKLTAALWSVDEDDHGRVHFSVQTGAADALAVATTRKPWAAAYLDDVKLQFELEHLTLDGTAGRHMLHADMPTYMVRLPRRHSVRVRRTADDSPVARSPHPLADEPALQVRVLDISLDGCALLRPASVAPLSPGDTLSPVQIELGGGTTISAKLRVRHVTPGPVGLRGWRIGCEWQTLDAGSEATLKQWIDGGQRRRQVVSLELD